MALQRSKLNFWRQKKLEILTKKFEKYKVKFLPVNEIENFAVLTDSYYTEDMLKEFENNNKMPLIKLLKVTYQMRLNYVTVMRIESSFKIRTQK